MFETVLCGPQLAEAFGLTYDKQMLTRQRREARLAAEAAARAKRAAAQREALLVATKAASARHLRSTAATDERARRPLPPRKAANTVQARAVVVKRRSAVPHGVAMEPVESVAVAADGVAVGIPADVAASSRAAALRGVAAAAAFGAAEAPGSVSAPGEQPRAAQSERQLNGEGTPSRRTQRRAHRRAGRNV